MKAISRLSVVAAVIAALCLAPAAIAKPPPKKPPVHGKTAKPAKPGKPGKPGKPPGKPGTPKASGAGPVAPGGPPHRHRPGGPPVAVPPPVPPATYYSLGYHTHGGYADSIVASVQRALKARGYYRGPVNGDAGSGTRAAIRGFRADHGLGHSSRIDGPLLRALGL